MKRQVDTHASELMLSSLLLLCCLAAACYGQTSAEMAQVSQPKHLQRALASGTPHIVITEHLDLSGLPRDYENSIATAAVAYAAFGTRSIRVRCHLANLLLCLHHLAVMGFPESAYMDLV